MNLRVRFRNPVFIFQLILSFFTPILTYAGLTFQDIDTWERLWMLLVTAFQNPYVLVMIVVSVWNALNDPTTEGVKDSARAMTYEKPAK